MKFIKKYLKYIILVVVCMIGAIIYSYSISLHTKTNSNNEYREQGDLVNYACFTNFGTYNTRLTAVVNNYLDVLYPVGSIYFSVEDSTADEVAARFGGTWEAYAAGRTLVGYNSSDTRFSTIGGTGGSLTRSLSADNIPSHTHTYAKPSTTSGGTALQIGHLPSHTHTLSGITMGANGSGTSRLASSTNGRLYVMQYNTNTSLWNTNNTTYSGTTSSVKTFNIGYGVTYVDGEDGTAQEHTHSISTSSATTEAAGSGDSFSIQDPYIVVYMWHRTA